MKLKYHLKFYADTPSGRRNKLFCFGVHHGRHAADLLARFKARGFKLRAAHLGSPGAKGTRLPRIVEQLPGTLGSAANLLMRYPP